MVNSSNNSCRKKIEKSLIRIVINKEITYLFIINSFFKWFDEKVQTLCNEKFNKAANKNPITADKAKLKKNNSESINEIEKSTSTPSKETKVNLINVLMSFRSRAFYNSQLSLASDQKGFSDFTFSKRS